MKTKLLGFDSFTSQKTNKKFAKIYILQEEGAKFGDSCFEEIVQVENDSFIDFLADSVGEEVRIDYNKGYNGKAYISHIEKI